MNQNTRMFMERTEKENLVQFKESFETFNTIINNLQRQYLSLEKEYRTQEEKLSRINKQLLTIIAENNAVSTFLNSILNSVTSGVIAVDENGMISHFNPAAEKITGIPASHALGNSYNRVLSAASGEKFSAIETIHSSREFVSDEKCIININGEEIAVSVSTALLKNDSGRTVGAVEIFFDLTKIKRLEEEINRVKTLAALGEMAATVAHNVRNPLGGIKGFASLLKRELEQSGDDDKVRLVEKIIAGVNTLNETVTALLDYTRRDQLSLRQVPLDVLVTESAEYEKADLENSDHRIDLEIKNETTGLRINCDPHLMRQVILNLLRNSREAMPQGGRITIRSGVEKEAAADDYRLAWIEVEDSGAGIPEEIQDRVFRPFFSTKDGAQGSGLGLASVWKTVKAHGGDIELKSKVNQGTVFRITLPLE